MYKLVRNLPVAKFDYQGASHSHPVRRTVLIHRSTPNYIVGYELREGSEVRSFKDAPVKTFKRNRIAKIKQLDSRRILRKRATKDDLDKTTFARTSLLNLVTDGA